MLNYYKDKNVAEYFQKYKSLEEYILGKNLDPKYVKASKFALIDCDGIISTGESFYNSKGKFLKSYGCYDKEMIKYLELNCNWHFTFVTDDKNGWDITLSRISSLGYNLAKASPDERKDIVKYYKSVGWLTIFIGDSLSDIPALVLADYNGTTIDAPEKVKRLCNYISETPGGKGALAEIMLNLHEYINDEFKNNEIKK